MEAIFTVGTPQLRKNHPSLFNAGIGDDFFVIEDYDSGEKGRAFLELLKGPLRFDGLFFFYCIDGAFDVDINLLTYSIRPKSLVINTPGNIFRISDETFEKPYAIRYVCIGMSRNFLSGLRVDFSKTSEESMKVLAHPCITLDAARISMASDYFHLMQKVLDSTMRDKKNALGKLISSLSYMLLDAWHHLSLDNILSSRQTQNSARAQDIFERFLNLVAEHHSRERGMAFYADKLCLTPKYLSKLIKQVSGRRAPEWIDSYVILEAKNMLRYSEIPIKEIVYRLNFPNQSVFYKFFKMHTGMTPSAYRNS